MKSNHIYLAFQTIGSEYGLPTIFINMKDASLEDTIISECSKYLPYRLCEFTINYTVTAITKLLENGFEVVVNLDTVEDIKKIPRATKIKLTLNITQNNAGIEFLGTQDEIIFSDVISEKDVIKLKNSLTESMTRARVYLLKPEDISMQDYQQFINKYKLPVSLLERQ